MIIDQSLADLTYIYLDSDDDESESFWQQHNNTYKEF